MASTAPFTAPISVQSQTREYRTHDERQEALLFESVISWFNKNPSHLESVLKVLIKRDKSTLISLTLLDWLVSSFAKVHNCHYKCAITGEMCNIYEQYTLQLKGYSKRRSDPFCRSQRFRLTVQRPGKKTETIVSSVRQLNFLRWIAMSGILDYVIQNVDWIHSEYIKAKEQSKTATAREDITELTASRPLFDRTSVHVGTFDVNFD